MPDHKRNNEKPDPGGPVLSHLRAARHRTMGKKKLQLPAVQGGNNLIVFTSKFPTS